MAVRNVVIFPDEDLRKENTEVTEFDSDLAALCQDMFDTMYKFEGIGLAAPQIGVHKKIVVIDIPDAEDKQGDNQLILINPKVLKLEGEIIESPEGCLSVPSYQDTVVRYEKCTVEYQDLKGEKHLIEQADGLFGICLQHETDHLDGKLFIDMLSRLKKEKLKKKYGKILKELKAKA